MNPSPSIAHHNGAWVPHDSLSIGLNDLGFRQGVTAVERLRTYGGRLFQVGRHADRWQTTTQALLLDGLPDRNELFDHASQLLVRNADFIEEQQDVGMTWLATPGESIDKPATFIMHLQMLRKGLIERFLSSGQPIVVTDVRQPPSESWSRQIKVRCRLHYYFADVRANQVVPNASGVLVDSDGSVTETSLSNLAVVFDETIASPPVDQVLSGVTQQVVKEIAANSGIEWRHRRLSASDLVDADDVLLMGTDAGLWRASQVDDHCCGDPTDVFVKLRQAFDQVTQSGTDSRTDG